MNQKTLDAMKALGGFRCRERVQWFSKYETVQQAWDACKRADWMVWLLAGTCEVGSPRHKRLVALVCHIAHDALLRHRKHLQQCVLDRDLNKISLVERWATGKITLEQAKVADDGRCVGGLPTIYYTICTIYDPRFAVQAVGAVAEADADVAFRANNSKGVSKYTLWIRYVKRYADFVRDEFPEPPRLKGQHK